MICPSGLTAVTSRQEGRLSPDTTHEWYRPTGNCPGMPWKNIVFFRPETRSLYAVEDIGQVDEPCAKSLADGLMAEAYAKYRLSSGISTDNIQ